ncbi:MAG: glycerophosphodiester phosphodiesterase family protein [Legionellaceae bacterium]|nr:glycerophosphodiester phosphodiesterase family protein [Legionellaceae bacterium]
MITLAPLIAHRGASPYAPENTIAAFNKAFELGARAIEFDVMMCADGGLFVFHDEILSRTTDGVGTFSAASSEYIQTLDAGSWFAERFQGESVPSLADALAWCAAHRVQANIEIKPHVGEAEAITAAFLACLNRYWSAHLPQPLVSSFDRDVLRMCARLSPELPLGVLFLQWEKNWSEIAEEVQAFSVHLSQYWLTRRRMRAIKDAGYKVLLYTVNSKERAKHYWDWGADFLVSDYPDLLEE